MKNNTYEYPKSSFLGMSKDTAIIMNKLLSDAELLKLLYYMDRDWSRKSTLTPAQQQELFDRKIISCIPKVEIDPDIQTYVRISYDSFTPSGNDFYRDHLVEIKIICHFGVWDLGNFEMRPYRIAGEIDALLDKKKLTGIGELQFLGADQDIYDEEFGGITLRYLAIRGHEDDVNPIDGRPIVTIE